MQHTQRYTSDIFTQLIRIPHQRVGCWELRGGRSWQLGVRPIVQLVDQLLARLDEAVEEDERDRLVECPQAEIIVRNATSVVAVHAREEVVGEVVHHRFIGAEAAEGVTLHQLEDLRLRLVKHVGGRLVRVGLDIRKGSVHHLGRQVHLALRAVLHVSVDDHLGFGGALRRRELTVALHCFPEVDVLLGVLLRQLLFHPLLPLFRRQYAGEVEVHAHLDELPEFLFRKRPRVILVEHGEDGVDLLHRCGARPGKQCDRHEELFLRHSSLLVLGQHVVEPVEQARLQAGEELPQLVRRDEAVVLRVDVVEGLDGSPVSRVSFHLRH
mmetsp:Transcript_5002/g.7698  ORF Transcript_5002/g.7698 Transcript_5002/m.7698 type:complete len:325 (+) Transcript_5002:327-1301(+)